MNITYLRRTFFEKKNHAVFPNNLQALFNYFYENHMGDIYSNIGFLIALWHFGNSFDLYVPKTIMESRVGKTPLRIFLELNLFI